MRAHNQRRYWRRSKPRPVTLAPVHDHVAGRATGAYPSEAIQTVQDIVEAPWRMIDEGRASFTPDPTVELEPAVRRDGSRASTGGEWLFRGRSGSKILRSVRTDPLGWMRARGFVGEDEYQAGRRYQALLEASELGGIKAMDWTRERVDGGRPPELLTERQRTAIRELPRIEAMLGPLRTFLVRRVLGESESLHLIRKAFDLSDRYYRRLQREFVAALGLMAQEFDLRGGREFA